MVERKERRALQEAPMDGFNVRLTAWHVRVCRKAGDGNMAAGIRMAIEALADIVQEKSKQPKLP